MTEHLNKIMTYMNPASPASEAIKCLRTNTLFLNNDNKLKVIGFTSSISGEGKTFLVSNFAVAAAHGKKKTILVDGDIRKHGLTKLLDFRNKKGLADILESGVDNPDDLPIYETGMDNLHIIPSGALSTHPSELLQSDTLNKVFIWLKERYDVVCVDMPPVLAVTDSMILCKKVDGVIFSVMAHSTVKSAVERAYQQLEESNVNIIGSVLNKVDTGAQKYKYKYGYYYSYAK